MRSQAATHSDRVPRRGAADRHAPGVDRSTRGRERTDHRVPLFILIVLVALGAIWYVGFGMAQDEEARREQARQALAAQRPAAGSQALAVGATTEGRFNSEAAFQRLKEQCDLGPRFPGSDGHARCLAYLGNLLKPLANRVESQPFSLKDGSRRIAMTNLIARFDPVGARAVAGAGVILAAHWDTRPTADQDPNPANHPKPIIGANDGGSGVAVLLEIAKMLKAKPPTVPVWIVLFDGEDYGPGIDRMFLGAKYFAENLPADVPRKGVLLDMVGDRNLEIFKEIHSVRGASAVVESVWETAKRLGHRAQFNPSPKHAIQDDHLPLLDKGIAMIDIIDFDYPPWHTLEDTVDKCSAASLGVVGDVVATWTYEQKG